MLFFISNYIVLVDEIGFAARNRYGQECRHCPTNGTCVDGKLSCEAGFVVVGGKVCVEDQESSVFGEELANEANKILSHVAGDAECRGIESRFLSRSDLREILRPEYSKTSTGGLFFWGTRKFDPAKFDVSFDKAIRRLEGEGFPDVHISQSGFSSNSPVMSLRCTAKLALRRNWRVVAAFIAACLLLLCLKIWLYIRRRQKEELEGAFGLALGYLREQKTGFVHREEELAFISDVVLRQEVLGSPTEKTVRLWKKVEAMLRNDSRVAWSANRVVKGVPSNTFEWRGRLAKGSVYSSGGSLRSLDSPGLSEGEGRTPAIESWIEEARRRLFTRY